MKTRSALLICLLVAAFSIAMFVLALSVDLG